MRGPGRDGGRVGGVGWVVGEEGFGAFEVIEEFS